MKAGIVYFTPNGEIVGAKLKKYLVEKNFQVDIRTKDLKLKDWTKKAMCEYDLVVFISATGIAVRTISSFLVSKIEDPAVLCIDERANFVVPLISGHIGGANDFARDIGQYISAIPVITTATDVNGKIAIDSFAVKNDLVIDDMIMAKKVAMALVSNISVGFKSQIPVDGPLPTGLTYNNERLGVFVSYTKERAFEQELKLVPKRIVLGIGCKKNMDFESISSFVLDEIEKLNIDIRAIEKVASIDIKKDEKGLIEFSERLGIPFITYSANELNQAVGDFPSSEFVKRITGTDNVCERAVALGSDAGEILLGKSAKNGVTISIAVRKGSLHVK